MRISNAFGTAPLKIGHASIAKAGAGADLVPSSLRVVKVRGLATFSVPAGGFVDADPVALSVQPFERLAISLHVPKAVVGMTQHSWSRTTNYVGPGDLTATSTGAGMAPTPGRGRRLVMPRSSTPRRAWPR